MAILWYSVQPFSGMVARFRIIAAEGMNGLKSFLHRVGAGGHNNIRINPVFRGMVRRFGELDY